MKTLGERLIWARMRIGLSQHALAKHAGVSQSTIGNLEAGSRLTARKITAIASALNVDSGWLAEGVGQPTSHPQQAIPSLDPPLTGGGIPPYLDLYQVTLTFSAGSGTFIPTICNRDATLISLRTEWLARRGYTAEHLIAIEVIDRGMAPTVSPGDVAVVNLGDTALQDGAAYAINYEGEIAIKRVIRDLGKWYLTSDNPEKMQYQRQEYQDGAGIVIGRIVLTQHENI